MLPVIPGFAPRLPGSADLHADAVALAVDPGVVLDAPVPVRAAASFVLVLAFGWALLYRFEEFVTESIESSMERPLVSTLYGVAALGAVVFLGLYALSQVATVGAGDAVADLATVAIGVVVVTLVSLGFTVVGTWLVRAAGEHRHWSGLVAGAALSAVPWLLPWLGPGLLAWVALGGMGIGGPTRNWIRASESIESEDGAG